MARKSQSQYEAAARAREGLARKRLGLDVPRPSSPIEVEDSDDEECCWDGEVNCYSEAESDAADWVDDEDLLSDLEMPDELVEAMLVDAVQEMVGEELTQSLEDEAKRAKSAFDEIMRLRSEEEWKQADASVQAGARDGKSESHQRKLKKAARDEEFMKSSISDTVGAQKFMKMFVTTPADDANMTLQARAELAAASARKESDAKFKSATRQTHKAAGKSGQQSLMSMFGGPSRTSTAAATGKSSSDLPTPPAGMSSQAFADVLAKAREAASTMMAQDDADFEARTSGPVRGNAQPVRPKSVVLAKPAKAVPVVSREPSVHANDAPNAVQRQTVTNRAVESHADSASTTTKPAGDDFFSGYLSDLSEDAQDRFPDADEGSDVEDWLDDDLDTPGPHSSTIPSSVIDPILLAEDAAATAGNHSSASFPALSHENSAQSPAAERRSRRSPSPAQVEPARKRQRLEIPVRQSRVQRRAGVFAARRQALLDLQKLIESKKTRFESGANGLQARRARAIESCLHLVVNKQRKMMESSRVAALANRFAEIWGSRLVRSWTQVWVKDRTLPDSDRGQHAKVQSIFDDPVVRAEIRAYLRSHKWSLNPPKLKKFLDNELERGEAESYAKELLSKEMPRGLKAYVEETVLPRMHLKSARLGLSLASMRRLMIREGFAFTEHKKAIFYDGHERPDVVADRTDRFIPAMQAIRPKLVNYAIGDVEREVHRAAPYDKEPKYVLVAHDEMTAQCHDGQKRSWGPVGEQPLRKKGAGRGIHVSGFVCSTEGWLEAASVTMEYGTNHEGWWNGELFIKQLKEKFFPAFEAAHGPDAIAVVLVDNSQGHSAYAEDALRVSRMNMRPGGKQAHMRDGWFERDGERITQRMVFDEAGENPKRKAGDAKGMQRVLEERGLFRRGMLMQCKAGCDDEATDCCATRTLSLQPDFLEQESLVQETIQAAGHICIMLPKYHCEINFIEYFWGAVKRYLREHCDYTFNTLRENMPIALRSVSKLLIREWEHRAWRFIDAYAGGLGAKDAQFQVKKFSSRVYTSHRRIPEGVAAALDV